MKQKSLNSTIGKFFIVRTGIRLKPLACFVFLLSLCLMSNTTQAQNISDGDINITASGDYVITGSSTTNRIIVAPGVTANITLNSVGINLSGTAGACAFEIQGSSTVNLTLVGANALSSGNSRAGLEVPAGATLTVDGMGQLTANGGNGTISGGGGAGIGGRGGTGDSGGNSGNILIYGGTIIATGGDGGTNSGGGAGIGGGGGDDAFAGGDSTDDIIISGGKFTATGGNGASNGAGGAGIGGGGGGNGASGNGGNYSHIAITGLTDNSSATGGNSNSGGGAGIGGGGGGGSSSPNDGVGGTGIVGVYSGIIIFPLNVSVTKGSGMHGTGANVGSGGGKGIDGIGAEKDYLIQKEFPPKLNVPTVSIIPPFPEKSYIEGESIDLSNLIIQLVYSEGYIFTIKYASFGSLITTNYTHGTILYDTDDEQKVYVYYNDGVDPHAANAEVITLSVVKKTTITPVSLFLAEPVACEEVSNTVTHESTEFTAVAAWSPAPGATFEAGETYTATITLTATDNIFDATTIGGFTINGNALGSPSISGDKKELVFTAAFPATAANLSASLNQTDAVFPDAAFGYDISEIDPQKFTLTNTSAGKITGLTATLYNGAGSAFVMIDDWSTTTIDPGGKATISFRPKPGLPISSTPYSDELIIHWNEECGGGCIANLSFPVLFRKGITVKPNEGHSLYGESPKNPGFTAEGLINGDTEAILTGLYTNFYINSTTHADPYLIEVEGELDSNSNYFVIHRYPALWRVYKLPGAEIEELPAISGDPTDRIITVTSVGIPVNPGKQTVEYAIATNNDIPASFLSFLEWQPETTFAGDFTKSAAYFVYARSAENTNYLAGEAKVSLPVTYLIKTELEDIRQMKSLNALIHDGVLHVSGLTAGKPWSVYNLAGMLLHRDIAKSDVETQQIESLQNHGVYIVISEGRTAKVIF